MRCQTCDYRLWNLPSRVCPECGTPFKPSEFEFTPSSVQFCCPHCDQAYYGTDQKGHLVPRAFACQRCGKPVDMDEMVRRPGIDVKEEQTRQDVNPWLDRPNLGWIRSWFRTVGQALGLPARLMRATPADSPRGAAWLFAAITGMIYFGLGVSPLVLFIAFIGVSFAGGGLSTAAILGIGLGMIAAVFIGAIVAILIVVAWGLCTHGLLLIGGGKPQQGIGRTFEALGYASGANILIAVPCLGPYMFTYFSWIWWAISAVFTVKEGQRVSGGRAAFAVLTPPGVVAGLMLLSFVALMGFAMLQTPTGMPVTIPPVSTTPLASALNDWSAANEGAMPLHALQLLADGRVVADDFLDAETNTFLMHVPVGDVTLDDWDALTPEEQAAELRKTKDAMPDNVIAHRVGDYVFTYHGVPSNNFMSSMLWLAVLSPDPQANSSARPGWVQVIFPNGASTNFPFSDMQVQLQGQNMMRQQAGLPPLPDPATVTHDQPALAPPAEDPTP